MDNKAELVYIGTPFALTYESSIHNDVKQRLLLMNKSNIETTQLSLLEIDPANRNTVILGKLKNKDNLKYGVKGEGGYIFAGHALDSIDKIVSVHDIVEYMTSSLSF
jgi:hypothetical protein